MIDRSFREFIQSSGWALPDDVVGYLAEVMTWATLQVPLPPQPTLAERYFWLADHGSADLWRDYADRVLWTLGVWPQWRVSRSYREDLCGGAYWHVWLATGSQTSRVISGQVKICALVINQYVGQGSGSVLSVNLD
jgi:hypothetical protein